MEVAAALSLQSCSLIGLDGSGNRNGCSVRLPNRWSEQRKVQAVRFGDPKKTGAPLRSGYPELKIACCSKKNTGSENFHNSVDAALILKSKVLKDLSSMHRLVVATGGGAVIRPINWKYMKQGLTVWLDVPLEALARRIAAVGTASRPLLHQESGDPYQKVYLSPKHH
ncbi:hypothetical protein GW17_00043995 [Ensete ventricosum]|nr:hypothetical protein GW17_00043995 [Ensete ventricosum]RZS13232.1 hypothetical protein BHM03_00044821 [Ensete ventricosum]